MDLADAREAMRLALAAMVVARQTLAAGVFGVCSMAAPPTDNSS